MRSVTLILSCCALVSLTKSADAQMSYTAKGGNVLVPTVLSTVDMPDGSVLVRTEATGFTWTSDDTAVGGNGSIDCLSSNTINSEGEPLDGSGTCECIDADGDVWWVWFDGGLEGEFGFTGGTGKYSGIDGGGTWTTKTRYVDGKAENAWEGTWTIPAHEMGME